MYTLSVAVQGAFLCLLAYFCYNFFLHSLARVPGPISARLGIPWFRLSSTISRSYVWRLQAMHRKYGPLVRLGPNFVSTTDPATVGTLYAFGGPFHKTHFYDSFCAYNPCLSCSSIGKTHRAGACTKLTVWCVSSVVEDNANAFQRHRSRVTLSAASVCKFSIPLSLGLVMLAHCLIHCARLHRSMV